MRILRFCYLGFLLCLLIGTVANAGRSQKMVIDSFIYPSELQARIAWMKYGAAQNASINTMGQSKYILFPCTFSAEKTRAYWDKDINLDLSRYNSINMRVKIDNPSAIGSFGLYFQTNTGGWFAMYQVASLSTDKWQNVSLPMSAFVTEGECSGWKNIRRIRISAFSSTNTDHSVIRIKDFCAVIKGNVTNLLPNSSFEICSVEKLPEYWGTEHWGLRKPETLENTDAWRAKWGVDDTTSHSGHRSLHITGSSDLSDSMAASIWLSLMKGTTYTFSVWLKSRTADMPVDLVVAGVGSKQVKVGTEWKRYSLTGTYNQNDVSRCFISSQQSGDIWIDDAQLEVGDNPTKYSHSSVDENLKVIKPIRRKVTDPGAYPVKPGSNTVSVEIDKNRRFLVDGQPFIPFALGWEGMPSPTAINEIAKAGFNSVCFTPWPADFPKIRPILDLARQNGLKVILWFPSALSVSDVENWINSFKDHSSIIAWYIYDEPNEITPELQQKYDIAKKTDPTRPVYINYVFYPKDMLGDIASRDWYPIPGDSPAFMGQATDMLEIPAAKSGKPSWIWLQIHGYAYCYYREPWETEEECMTYISLIHGARGIKYFVHKPHSDALWIELKILSREVRILTPILYSLEQPDQVNLLTRGIDFTVKKYQGKNYIIAVNTKPTRNKAVFKVSSNGRNVTVLFENRSVQQDKDKLSDTFEPYQRHVYEIE